VQAAAGDESAVSVEAEAAEGVDADVAIEHTVDEEVTAVAVDDPHMFAATFVEAVIASDSTPRSRRRRVQALLRWMPRWRRARWECCRTTTTRTFRGTS
jgi:hypothetical protein